MNKPITILILALAIGACSFFGYSDISAAVEDAKVQQQSAEYVSPAEPITQEDIDQYGPIALYVVLGLLVIAGINKILHSELAIPFVTIVGGLAIVLLASYLFTYGDKNNDGIGDTQIIKVVQPVGEAGIDTQYAEINHENTKTNFMSVVSITVYSVMLLVAMVVVTGIGVVLHYYTRAKGS